MPGERSQSEDGPAQLDEQQLAAVREKWLRKNLSGSAHLRPQRHLQKLRALSPDDHERAGLAGASAGNGRK